MNQYGGTTSARIVVLKVPIDSLDDGRSSSSLGAFSSAGRPISSPQASSQSGGDLTTIATPNGASAGSPISSRQTTNQYYITKNESSG